MSFISYAQNFEDVTLHRALKEVDKGFYIDVGANDPITDSVTKAFYDSGWRGINIEPVSAWFEKLLADRPEDINLQTAVGNREGTVEIYDVIDTGLSTLDKSIAERHAREQGYEIENYKVPITTLSAICEAHPCKNIHFLKIDVEGAEKEVLQSLDLKRIRPWICLVESTLPNLEQQDHENWEHILLGADYEFAYFDGLNRFYVAKEHQELGQELAKPPNYFDNFILSSSYFLQKQIAETQASQLDAQEQNEKKEEVLRNTRQQLAVNKTLVKSLLSKENKLIKQIETVTTNSDLKDAQISKLIKQVEKVTAELVRQNEQLREKEVQVETLKMESSRNEMLKVGLNRQLQDVYKSKSWKITLPLRKLLEFMILLRGLPGRLGRKVFRSRSNKMIGAKHEFLAPHQQPEHEGSKTDDRDSKLPQKALSSLEETPDLDELLSPDAIANVSDLIHKGIQK